MLELTRRVSLACAAVLLTRCAATPVRHTASSAPPASSTPAPAVLHLTSHAIMLPGGPGLVRMDYIAFDPHEHRVWIPAGNTGRVDVLDTTNDQIHAIEGFGTLEREMHGEHRVFGPSSVTVGEGVVYVGNRADSHLCPIDTHTLQVAPCLTLPASPDGVTLMHATHELWITLPAEHQLAVVHVDGLTQPGAPTIIPLDGRPEGYALDEARGLFYTNLEDADRTVVVDVHTHHVVSNWAARCGENGPRGLYLDAPTHRLFVACTDHVVVLDTQNGHTIGGAPTGGGVDGIDYLASRHLLYVGSGEAAALEIYRVDDDGSVHPYATAPTAPGARNPVVDENGRAYLSESATGHLFVVQTPAP